MSGNPENPNVNVSHLILSSRPSESIKLSFVWHYGTIRIEDAIPTEKHPQATFLTQKPLLSDMPQLSIITITLSRWERAKAICIRFFFPRSQSVL